MGLSDTPSLSLSCWICFRSSSFSSFLLSFKVPFLASLTHNTARVLVPHHTHGVYFPVPHRQAHSPRRAVCAGLYFCSSRCCSPREGWSFPLSGARLPPTSTADLSRGWRESRPTGPAQGDGFRRELAVSHRHHGSAGERAGRRCQQMPLRNTGCLEAWRKARRDGAREAAPLFSEEEALVLWARPRAQRLSPDLNAPLITHRKWVWTLHTGRWLALPTRCGKPFWGNDLKCWNILFLSLPFLCWIPQFEWEPLWANRPSCGILRTPWREFRFVRSPVRILHLSLQLPLARAGLSEQWEVPQGARYSYSWKWTNVVKKKNYSVQLAWVRLEHKALWVPNIPAWAVGQKWEKVGLGTDLLAPSKSS